LKKPIFSAALMLVLLLLTAAPAFALIPDPDVDCLSWAYVDHFLVCFVGATDNDDGTSTWTYAVQSDDDRRTAALASWTLELCEPAIDNVDPGDRETYTTVTGFGDVTGRSGIEYAVRVGFDWTTGVRGIKFVSEFPHYLGAGGRIETDIFQFTLLTEDVTATPIEVNVAARGGVLPGWGFILGPECGATAVTLAAFTAQADATGVTLAWQTGTEIDNAGFNLYRATTTNGPWVKLNGALIGARGNAVSGASYSFMDAPGYGTFFYRLEDVDYGGVSTLHGPANATLAPPFRRPLHRPTLPGS
jgi:hypothetical protein